MKPNSSFVQPLKSLPISLSLIQNIDFPHKLGVCEYIYGTTLEKHGVCWIKTGGSIVWKLDLSNPTHRWIVYGKYEGASFLNWAKSFIPRDGVVVDSGANIGQMLLYISQWIPNGRLLAFEPDKEAIAWLKECLNVNSYLPVELIEVGLGHESNQLYLKKLGQDYHHGAQNQISETEGYPIEIATLSEQFTSKSLSHIDLWILDIEGYEIPALQGASKLLQDRLIRALYIEMHGENGLRIRDYLQKFNYQCYFFKNSQIYPADKEISSDIYTNGLFLPAA